MENYVKGKIKKIIFKNEDNGFLVALFKIRETNILELEEKINKTITISGTFLEANSELDVKLTGEYKKNEKYGYQFVFSKTSIILPSEKDSLIEFFSSKFISGCGEKTAKAIVETLGNNAIEIIKNDINSLDEIEGISDSRKEKIYNSVISFASTSEVVVNLQNKGFTVEEASRIYNKYKDHIEEIISYNIYLLSDIIDFKKLDNIFLKEHDENDDVRVKACIIESMKLLSFNNGDTYSYKEEIIDVLRNLYKIFIDDKKFEKLIKYLVLDLSIYVEDDRYYLSSMYNDEVYITKTLKKIDSNKIEKVDYSEYIKNEEKIKSIIYNDEQISAINESLNNNITIISGGPGTGKSTILDAICSVYIKSNNLSSIEVLEHIALLAPTGRASKKMASSTKLPASTIHRYLKWNKDTDEFSINEYNKNIHKLIIVDEASMIDLNLFASLLRGLNNDIKLILVGDVNQLPSVGPGSLLKDLIDSDLFSYIELKYIYRQSDNSYIPYLAKDIRNREIDETILDKKDDYNFIKVDNKDIIENIKKIVEFGKSKGLDDSTLQILAPMYRGVNGINNLNFELKKIFNPNNNTGIRYGDVVYSKNDKVLQLVNDPDKGVFNGDIGYIIDIDIKDERLVIDFDGNIISITRKDFKNIRHAYAITIHKSQGSEFDNVIVPCDSTYGSMFYNRLIYTAVSRAKKSLILIGSPQFFARGVNNNYGSNRKTTLMELLINEYNK